MTMGTTLTIECGVAKEICGWVSCGLLTLANNCEAPVYVFSITHQNPWFESIQISWFRPYCHCVVEWGWRCSTRITLVMSRTRINELHWMCKFWVMRSGGVFYCVAEVYDARHSNSNSFLYAGNLCNFLRFIFHCFYSSHLWWSCGSSIFIILVFECCECYFNSPDLPVIRRNRYWLSILGSLRLFDEELRNSNTFLHTGYSVYQLTS